MVRAYAGRNELSERALVLPDSVRVGNTRLCAVSLQQALWESLCRPDLSSHCSPCSCVLVTVDHLVSIRLAEGVWAFPLCLCLQVRRAHPPSWQSASACHNCRYRQHVWYDQASFPESVWEPNPRGSSGLGCGERSRKAVASSLCFARVRPQEGALHVHKDIGLWDICTSLVQRASTRGSGEKL